MISCLLHVISYLLGHNTAGVSSSIVPSRGCLSLSPPKKTTAPDGRLSVPDFTIILKVLFILFQTLESISEYQTPPWVISRVLHYY